MRMQKEFLWGCGSQRKRIFWVSWERVCKLKEWGRLKINDIKLFNEALLTKWKRRLMGDEQGLWKKVADESRWWSDLRKVCESIEHGN